MAYTRGEVESFLKANRERIPRMVSLDIRRQMKIWISGGYFFWPGHIHKIIVDRKLRQDFDWYLRENFDVSMRSAKFRDRKHRQVRRALGLPARSKGGWNPDEQHRISDYYHEIDLKDKARRRELYGIKD